MALDKRICGGVTLTQKERKVPYYVNDLSRDIAFVKLNTLMIV